MNCAPWSRVASPIRRVASRPPTPRALSTTVTSQTEDRPCAAVSPAMPAPITTTLWRLIGRPSQANATLQSPRRLRKANEPGQHKDLAEAESLDQDSTHRTEEAFGHRRGRNHLIPRVGPRLQRTDCATPQLHPHPSGVHLAEPRICHGQGRLPRACP